MKFKRLIVCCLVAFTLGCFFSQSSYANEENFMTKEEFLQAQQEGWIDEDISYEELGTLNEEAEQSFLEENFTKIAEAENFTDFEDFTTDFQGAIPYAYITKFQPGDVFVMTSDASHGFTGHVAMALSNNKFISIHGYGTHVAIFNRKDFKDNYSERDKIVVYRSNNYYWGVDASRWAQNTYENHGSDFNYAITSDLKDIYNTYCAKIVYHSYRYGAGEHTVTSASKGIIHPYRLYAWVKVKYHADVDGSKIE